MPDMADYMFNNVSGHGEAWKISVQGPLQVYGSRMGTEPYSKGPPEYVGVSFELVRHRRGGHRPF